MTHIMTHNRKNRSGSSGREMPKRNLMPNKKRPRVPKTASWALLTHFVISRTLAVDKVNLIRMKISKLN